MTTTIQKWGNSQGVRIPKYLLDVLNLNENDEIVLSAEDNKIIIRKANQRKNIIELFKDYDGDYTKEQIDWGEPVGREIW